jgi:hypothetical protein
MYLEKWDVYRNPSSTQIHPVTATPNAAGPDGENAAPGTASGNLGNADFWTSTISGPGFNSVQVPLDDRGTPEDTSDDIDAHYAWNMNGIARGYPRLAWQ